MIHREEKYQKEYESPWSQRSVTQRSVSSKTDTIFFFFQNSGDGLSLNHPTGPKCRSDGESLIKIGV